MWCAQRCVCAHQGQEPARWVFQVRHLWNLTEERRLLQHQQQALLWRTRQARRQSQPSSSQPGAYHSPSVRTLSVYEFYQVLFKVKMYFSQFPLWACNHTMNNGLDPQILQNLFSSKLSLRFNVYVLLTS